SGGISYSYDFENRMLTRGAVTIVYDGDGNRVSETAAGVTTKYLVDTLNPTGYSQVVDELVSGSVTRTYAYGWQRVSENQQISGTWTPSFYGYDGHGNVRFLTNTSGTVGNTYRFDAFGNQIASTGTTPNSFLYSGEQFDTNVSSYQMRARWYRPTVGRFITRDPVEGKRCCRLSWNPYIYVKQNPVNAADPTGLEVLEENGLFSTVVELGARKEARNLGLWRVAQANLGCPRRAGLLLVWEGVSDIRSGYDLVYNSSPDAPAGITDFQQRFPDKLRLSGAPNAQVVACLGHPSRPKVAAA
ncbi:MAG: RHS repeat-associated core domain-containing protein, partial [Terriglobales bacterium]